MKRSFSFIIIAALCMLFSIHVYAQEETYPKPNNSSGSVALLFSMSGFNAFNASGPSGNGANAPIILAGFGGRYYISDGLAIRGLLNFNTSSNSDTGTAKQSSSVIGVAAGLEYHLHQVYSTDIYIGGGVGYYTGTFTNTHVDAAHAGGENPQANSDNVISGAAFGLTVVGGFDWYIWNGIALGAEYSFGYSSLSASNTFNGTTTDQPTSSSLGITGGGNIHVVVAF
jgi:opacity protein-like surface antigen